MRVKIQRKQLKTIAKYIYHPSLHASWTELLQALEEVFDIQEVELRPPKYRRRNPDMPPPLPRTPHGMGKTRNSLGAYTTIHRGTPNARTLCGTIGWDVVTTEEDKSVTCKNCLLPKYQEKLRKQKAQEENDKVRDKNPIKKLPIVPHFLVSPDSSSSSEV